MYITPNSTIRVLHNINIDSDYQNTLYFANVSDQTSYFANNAKYTFPAQTYQRVNKNVVRVNRKADDLYDCCYMMFQNTSYGNKWFYAFIDSIEYVNDVTSNIFYHIDLIQTWLKDWTFKPCFVERMHTITDEIGDNIVEEHLDTGEMVFNHSYGGISPHVEEAPYSPYTDLLEMCIVLMVCDVTSANGDLIENIFNGAQLQLYHTDRDGITELNGRINLLSSKPDAIIGMYMCPLSLPGNFEDGDIVEYSDRGFIHKLPLNPISRTTWLDGYQPKNKKLLTYPYNYLHVDNGHGQSFAMRYEFFTDNNGTKNLTPQFLIGGCMTQPVTVTIEPKNYKNVLQTLPNDDRTGTLHTEILTLTGYPMCSWNMDSWKAWVAQNALPILADSTVNWAKTAVSAGMASSAVALPNTALETSIKDTSDYIGNKANVITQGGLSASGNILSQIARVALQADICRGNVQTGNENISNQKQTFFFGRVSVNAQTARIIDSFFDKYGYAINRIITPTITSRPYWNYLKTINCWISGNLPSDDKNSICKIFDRGITFWHDPAHMGEYALNNSPASP